MVIMSSGGTPTPEEKEKSIFAAWGLRQYPEPAPKKKVLQPPTQVFLNLHDPVRPVVTAIVTPSKTKGGRHIRFPEANRHLQSVAPAVEAKVLPNDASAVSKWEWGPQPSQFTAADRHANRLEALRQHRVRGADMVPNDLGNLENITAKHFQASTKTWSQAGMHIPIPTALADDVLKGSVERDGSVEANTSVPKRRPEWRDPIDSSGTQTDDLAYYLSEDVVALPSLLARDDNDGTALIEQQALTEQTANSGVRLDGAASSHDQAARSVSNVSHAAMAIRDISWSTTTPTTAKPVSSADPSWHSRWASRPIATSRNDGPTKPAVYRWSLPERLLTDTRDTRNTVVTFQEEGDIALQAPASAVADDDDEPPLVKLASVIRGRPSDSAAGHHVLTAPQQLPLGGTTEFTARPAHLSDAKPADESQETSKLHATDDVKPADDVKPVEAATVEADEPLEVAVPLDLAADCRSMLEVKSLDIDKSREEAIAPVVAAKKPLEAQAASFTPIEAPAYRTTAAAKPSTILLRSFQLEPFPATDVVVTMSSTGDGALPSADTPSPSLGCEPRVMPASTHRDPSEHRARESHRGGVASVRLLHSRSTSPMSTEVLTPPVVSSTQQRDDGHLNSSKQVSDAFVQTQHQRTSADSEKVRLHNIAVETEFLKHRERKRDAAAFRLIAANDVEAHRLAEQSTENQLVEMRRRIELSKKLSRHLSRPSSGQQKYDYEYDRRDQPANMVDEVNGVAVRERRLSSTTPPTVMSDPNAYPMDSFGGGSSRLMNNSSHREAAGDTPAADITRARSHLRTTEETVVGHLSMAGRQSEVSLYTSVHAPPQQQQRIVPREDRRRHDDDTYVPLTVMLHTPREVGTDPVEPPIATWSSMPKRSQRDANVGDVIPVRDAETSARLTPPPPNAAASAQHGPDRMQTFHQLREQYLAVRSTSSRSTSPAATVRGSATSWLRV